MIVNECWDQPAAILVPPHENYSAAIVIGQDVNQEPDLEAIHEIVTSIRTAASQPIMEGVLIPRYVD